ncbi:MAG: hypothetical protein IKA20_00900 [Clostridia bacterium]|nr:hypothetical protein [Clostridia bacterium]
MKRVKTLVLCLASVVGVASFAVACAEDGKHVHTYATEWSKDAEGHWYDATCECVDVPVVKVAHVDANNDGACDICAFTDHEHTYAEGWTADCTNHWHAADCGHIVAGADLAAHVDENSDGECDVCNYVIEDIHEHIYANEWSSDDQYHWYAAICEHKDQINGKEAHVINGAGDCTVCGKHINDVDATSIEDVLAAAQANNYKVNHGDVVASTEVWGGTGKGTLENGATDRVHFALGNGESYLQFTHFDMNGTFVDQKEQWFESAGEDVIYGVEMAYGEYQLAPIMGAPQFLNGYNYIPGSIVPGSDTDTSTIANMLSALYSQMKAGERVSNAVESYDATTGKYTFAYTYYSVNVTTSGGQFDNIELELYNVDVAFTVNEEMIIDWSEFEVEVYRDYEQDRDLAYTYEIGEDGATVTLTSDVTLSATANPSYYRYSVAQTAGERTFTTPYPRESLIPTDFNFYYVTDHEFPNAFEWVIHAEELIEDSLRVDEGTYAYFHLGDIMPITASTAFINSDDFTYSFVNKDASSTGRAWYMDPGSTDAVILNGYTASSGCLKLKLRDPGEYTVTIKFGNLTKTFDLTIVDIDNGGDDEGGEGGEGGGDDVGGDYDYNTVITENGGSVWFSTEEISAGGADRTFTVAANGKYKVSSSSLFVSAIKDAEGNVITADKGVYTLTAGEYTMSFGMFGNLSVKANTQYNVSVQKQAEDPVPPDDTKDISGTYLTSNGSLVINSETSTIVYAFSTYEFTYTYSISNNTVTLYKDGNEIAAGMAIYSGKLVLNADGIPTTWYYNGNTYSLTKASDEGGDGGDTQDPTEVTDVTITVGTNNLTLAENTYIGVMAQGFAGDYTIAWNVATVTVEINGTEVANGSTFTSASPMVAISFKIYGADYAAVSALELTITAVSSGSEGTGAEDNPYVIESLPTEVVINSDTINMTYYCYTTTEAGTITLTYSTENDSWANIFNMEDGQDNDSASETTVVEFAVAANATYRIGLGTWAIAGEATISITFTAGESGGDVGGGDDEIGEPVGTLYEGMINDITVTADDITKGYVVYSIFAMMGGNYEFVSGDLSVLAVIDSEGNELTAAEWGIYTLEEYASYKVKINTGWVSNAGTYQMSVTYQYPLGSQENPIELWAAGDNTADWQGGYMPIWYSYSVGEDGVLTVSTTSESATLFLRLMNDVESVDGTVSLNAIAGMTYYIGVMGAMGAAEEIPFTVSFVAGEYEGNGTDNMPTALTAGDNEVTIAEEYGSSYLMYKAAADGVLILTAGENCAYYVTYPEYAESVEGVYTVNMKAGEAIFVCVSTADGAADTIVLNVVFEELTAVSEGITLVAGDNNLTLAQYTYINVEASGFEGEYTVTWNNENVIVMVDGAVFANGETFYAYYPGYPFAFKIYAENYAAVESFTLTIAKVVVPAMPVIIGDNTVIVTDTYNGTNVVFTATEAGTYTFTAGTNAVLGYNYSNYLAGESFSVTLAENETVEFFVFTEDYSEGNVVVTIAKAGEVVEPEEPAQPDGTKENPFIVTELPYTITLTDKLDVYVQYTATEDCTLVITRTGGNVNDLPSNFENDLAAKTHTGTVTAGQVLLINFYAYSSKTYTISVAAPVEPEPDPEPDPDPNPDTPEYPAPAGSGTSADPYIIPSLPYGYTVTGKHDFYMQYTATEDCTLVISYTGGYITGLPNNFEKDSTAKTYTGTVTAGQVLKFNPWIMSSAADATYTYSFAKLVVEEPTPGEGEEGGETEGNVVTYISARHTNGRYIKVELDVANSKMIITRSNMSGGWDASTATAEYSYAYADGVVTAERISGTVCTFTWNADGTPLTVAWAGAAYENFEVQA